MGQWVREQKRELVSHQVRGLILRRERQLNQPTLLRAGLVLGNICNRIVTHLAFMRLAQKRDRLDTVTPQVNVPPIRFLSPPQPLLLKYSVHLRVYAWRRNLPTLTASKSEQVYGTDVIPQEGRNRARTPTTTRR